MQKSQSEQTGMAAHRKTVSTEHKSRRDLKRPSLKETRTEQTEAAIQTSAMPAQPVSMVQTVKVKQAQQPASAQQPVPVQQPISLQQMAPVQNKTTVDAQFVIPSVDMSDIHEKMRQRTTQDPIKQTKQTAQQIKQQEIQKALKTASATPKQKKAKKSDTKFHFGFGRVMLAFACAAAAVFAIVYFVNLNSPDISLKVAAMQTGIEASYPSYIPRDFSLSDITSEDGKVTLNFYNSSTGAAYTLIEEKSSWDSNALLSNFVKKSYGEDYTTIRENGLTIYIHGSDAAWVNGGVVYKLTCKSGSLTKKQIRAIAVSL